MGFPGGAVAPSSGSLLEGFDGIGFGCQRFRSPFLAFVVELQCSFSLASKDCEGSGKVMCVVPEHFVQVAFVAGISGDFLQLLADGGTLMCRYFREARLGGFSSPSVKVIA